LGFAAPPGNRDFQQTQAIGQAFLGPNIGFTPQSSAVNEQHLQRQNRASSFYPPLDQHSFQPNRQNVDFVPSVTRGHDPRRGGAQEELWQRNIPFNGRVSAERNRQKDSF
jgi:hypothetical protein